MDTVEICTSYHDKKGWQVYWKYKHSSFIMGWLMSVNDVRKFVGPKYSAYRYCGFTDEAKALKYGKEVFKNQYNQTV